MAKIESIEALRTLYASPKGRAVTKQLPSLEKHSRKYISLSPFLLLATSGADGQVDVTPRGEAPGIAQVLDDHTIALPDRPGNNRVDSFRNILENPEVGLLFMIPGVEETLRVNGSAEIRDDADLLQRFVVRDRLPISVLVVRVREVFLHCSKALMRSKLWAEASQVDRSLLPSMGQMLNEQIGLDQPHEDQQVMRERYKDELY